MTTIIDLIRHGEPVGGRRYRGGTDDPLSEKGWNQMWTAVENYHGWQQIISSPLSRCAAFANALSAKLVIPVSIDDRLAELGYGEWEGKTSGRLGIPISLTEPRRLNDISRLLETIGKLAGMEQIAIPAAADFHSGVAELKLRYARRTARADILRDVA